MPSHALGEFHLYCTNCGAASIKNVYKFKCSVQSILIFNLNFDSTALCVILILDIKSKIKER
jgi:hypothetical protein